MRRRQQGVILFIALIVLVAMSLTGIALMRSVDTNVLIAGNLAFRQGTTLAGDGGVEEARSWLAANTGQLNSDQPAGTTYYWANWQSAIDLIGSDPALPDYDWAQSRTVPAAFGTDAATYTVQYVIHRLCAAAGDPNSAAANCVKASGGGAGAGAASGGSKGTATYGSQALPGVSSVYYRITVRITGPRNTLSFIQAVVN